ncbi:hypothetical protein [Bacillus cereus]|uniref:hypothetical protein n=1 Tax=Bacillus cereus TaxID=1396 RepID=UPI001C8BD12B|nr:hypothetical protein [Bacillus cereus]MBX9158346.1 hypothetical protein [Bacillus cereus]
MEKATYRGFSVGDKVWDVEFGDSVIVAINFKEKLIVTDKDMIAFSVVDEYLSKEKK